MTSHLSDVDGVLLPAKAGDEWQWVAVDDDVPALLGPRRLSIGSHGYPQGWFDGRVNVLHRYLMGCSVKDGQIVDHINGSKLDARRANLRFVTPAENTQNRISGPMRGVHATPYGRFTAHVKHNGVKYHLGTFATAAEAHAVAAEYRRQHFTPLAS